jgi:oxalate decarboxylase/phosphoglucose isomerase-like protein (cupin superfamily)
MVIPCEAKMAAVEFIDLAPAIKEDAGGLSYFPWTGPIKAPADLLRTFHLISIPPGQIRGNHLHPGFEEWLYPFHGPGVLIWEAAPGEVRERLISGGRTLIRIPPGLPHALRNPGPEVLYLIAWRQASGAATAPETVPYPLGG